MSRISSSSSVPCYPSQQVNSGPSQANCPGSGGSGPPDGTGDSFSPDQPGYPWYHQELQSSDGTQIAVDYQQSAFSPSGDGDDVEIDARPAWLNVTSSNLQPTDDVEATYTENLGGEHGDPTPHSVKLSYAGDGRFTAQLPDSQIGSFGEGEPYDYTQGLQITVNGQPETDPISNSPQFQMDLYGNSGHAGGYYPGDPSTGGPT